MGKLFDLCLRKIYGIPSLSAIGGIWKSGKTDFALYIAENVLKLKQRNHPKFSLISKVASNIETNDERVEFISNLEDLRYWLHHGSQNKLFILDEANVHLMKRTAMSRMNVDTIRLLGEISKAHGRMIIVAQEVLGVDSEFLNPTWLRAIWIKTKLKSVRLFSHLLRTDMKFNKIPKTTIPFDPYRIAPFTERDLSKKLRFKDKFMDAFYRYCFNDSKISSDLGYHRQAWTRDLKAFGRKFFEKYGHTVEPSHVT